MKKIILLFLISALFSCTKEKTYLQKIQEFQYDLNKEFLNAKTSPLTKEDFKTFKSLSFFPIDKKYRVIARLEKTPNATLINIPTTDNKTQLYKTYGMLYFTIDGKALQLPIYQSQTLQKKPQYKDYLFLPFTDKTSGTTSYGGGRFVEIFTTDEIEEGKIIVDFNKAYNPYCAYSGRYSCPMTPKENHLDIAIKAGVKAYKKH